MAVMRRNGQFYVYFRPFKAKKIGVKVDVQTKGEAKQIEAALLRACRTESYSSLDPATRDAAVRMFQNQQWQVPPELQSVEEPPEELTLWRAIKICLQYPEVRESRNRDRHEHAFAHVVERLGKDFPVRQIWIPQIKQYQVERMNEGAAASTVNKERAALSKMFQVLVELGIYDKNPVRLTRGLSEDDGRREVYLSFEDFNAIHVQLPLWMRPIVQTLYLTGMRRNEALSMTWENVNLEARIVRLSANQTKERKPKRIPIHRLLVPVLESAKKVRSLASGRVFLTNAGRPPAPGSLRKPWVNAVHAVGLNPPPTIHDLRGVWKGNAMRSGMDFETREAIMGHSRGIAGRYGRFSDQDLLRAIDGVRFDEGATEIWVARKAAGELPQVPSDGSVDHSEQETRQLLATGFKKR